MTEEGSGNFGNGELQVIDRPAEAVADAMMVTQAAMITPVLVTPHEYLEMGEASTAQMEKRIEMASAQRCEGGAFYSLNFLSQKYPDLFDRMAALRTFERPFRDNRWYSHVYFLVRDTNGVYYAGSPANHTPGKESSLTRVVRSSDPQEIIDTITRIDGGIWPSGDFIRQSFDNSILYSHPSAPRIRKGKPFVKNINPAFDVFMIERDKGLNKAGMSQGRIRFRDPALTTSL